MNLRPLLSPRTHPIYTGRYLLSTTETELMYEEVSRWIYTRSPGGIIYGRQRIGKTNAIKFLQKHLPNEFGTDLPVFLVLCQEYKNANENVFFEDLLRNVRHPLASTSSRASIKRERLYNFLVDKGVKSVERRIVIILDDAQRLKSQHYEWLMDIYNELYRYGIEMTVILVGQRELKQTKDSFISVNKAQIVGRFMVHEHEFFGLRTLEDVTSCLVGYDLEIMFPPDSGCSLTQYFFPELFENGFRLSNMAQDIYESFVDLRKEVGLYNAIEIPMQYFTRTIEYILTTYGVEGQNVPELTISQIHDAIRYTNFLESEISASKFV